MSDSRFTGMKVFFAYIHDTNKRCALPPQHKGASLLLFVLF